MNTVKVAKLKRILRAKKRVAIALSGGLDSCVLLEFCARELGPENCLALCAQTPYSIKEEILSAQKLCGKLGVECITEKFSLPEVLKDNPPNRCYLCKAMIFKRLKDRAAERGFAVLCDGSNVSDLSDYRPGRKAAEELGIKSPLEEAGLEKSDIRALASELKNCAKFASKRANSCMLTRFPFGDRISPDKLRRAERAEAFLKELGLRGPRVRVHGNLARIELADEDFELFVEKRLFKIAAKGLGDLGYSFCALDLGGYRKGSFNNV